MRLFLLSPRLSALADWVPQGAKIADVGTDHAHLPVWLLKQGRIDRAIASDVRSGPLARARETAERFDVTEQISFRLCDGLAAVSPDEADTVILAGMGGETILQILSAAPWLQSMGCTLLLQPMSSLPDLRKWLSAHRCKVEKERIIRDGNSLYITMLVKTGEEQELSLSQQWLGVGLERDPLRKEYLSILQRRYEKALKGLAASQLPEDIPRRAEMEQVCAAIREEQQRMGGDAH